MAPRLEASSIIFAFLEIMRTTAPEKCRATSRARLSDQKPHGRFLMPKTSSFYLEVAAFVLLGVGAIAFLITQIIHDGVLRHREATYSVTAKFDNVGDLKLGASVSMAGVEVGRVRRIDLDVAANKASVLIELDVLFNRIPSDTDASINTQGFLGDKFIRLTRGVSSAYLHESSQILMTHSATSIDSLLRRISNDDTRPAPPKAAVPALPQRP